jgi:hypothetical protein
MDVTQRISLLPPRERRGSRVRCLLLTDGTRHEVAERLTSLAAPWGLVDSNRHYWLPQGLEHPQEAKLGDTLNLLSDERRRAVTDWWLAVRERANTPNWDIASTADIDGNAGLLLVEAKAHGSELKDDGKRMDGNAENHQQICEALKSATVGLNQIRPDWALSSTSCYQLANRFAWAWKIASLGVPVILVYLGFIGANEMRDQGEPLADGKDWERRVKLHAEGIVPESIWNDLLLVGSKPLRPLIRSMRLDIPSANNP